MQERLISALQQPILNRTGRVRRPHITTAQAMQIAALLVSRYTTDPRPSMRALAQEYGVSTSTVYQWETRGLYLLRHPQHRALLHDPAFPPRLLSRLYGEEHHP